MQSQTHTQNSDLKVVNVVEGTGRSVSTTLYFSHMATNENAQQQFLNIKTALGNSFGAENVRNFARGLVGICDAITIKGANKSDTVNALREAGLGAVAEQIESYVGQEAAAQGRR